MGTPSLEVQLAIGKRKRTRKPRGKFQKGKGISKPNFDKKQNRLLQVWLL